MPRTVADDVLDARREAVARLRLRGLSQREIVAELARQGFTNPDGGKPYSLGTVNSDVQALVRQWKAAAKKTTEVHRSQVLAELREVRRAGWAGAGNPDVTTALLTAMQDGDATVRAAAARSLGSVGLPDLGSILTALKQESDLYGLPAPKEVDLKSGGQPLEGVKVYLGFDPEAV